MLQRYLRAWRNDGWNEAASLALRLIACCSLMTACALFYGLYSKKTIYRNDEKLVSLTTRLPNDSPLAWRSIAFDDYRSLVQATSGIADIAILRKAARTLVVGGVSEVAYGQVGTSNLLKVLGCSPVVGHPEPSDGPSLYLSFSYWQTRFGGASEVLGTTISADGVPVKVAGVMPPSFATPFWDDDPKFWLLVPNHLLEANGLAQRGNLQCFARLQGNATAVELQSAADPVIRANRKQASDRAPVVIGLRAALRGDVAAYLPVLTLLASIFVAGCFTSLTAVRALDLRKRRAELATMMALGAQKRTLRNELWSRSIVATIVAFVLTVAVAIFVGPLLNAGLSAIPAIRRFSPFAFDPAVVAAVLVTWMAIEWLICLLLDPMLPGDDGIHASTTRVSAAITKYQQCAVMVNVGFSCMLVVLATGIVTAATRRDASVEKYVSNDVQTVRVALRGDRFSAPAARLAAWSALLRRFEAHSPGAVVGIIDNLAPENPGAGSVELKLPSSDGPDRAVLIHVRRHLGRALDVLGIQGANQSILSSASVAVVSATLRQSAGDAVSVGRAIDVPGILHPMSIGAVVSDSLCTGATAEPFNAIYVPMQSAPPMTATVVIRAGAPMTLRTAQQIVWGFDANSDVYRFETIRDAYLHGAMHSSLISRLIVITCIGVLVIGTLGSLITVISVVRSREKEFAVRAALGLQPLSMALAVGRSVFMLAGIAAIAGTLAGLVLTESIQRYGLEVRSEMYLSGLVPAFLLCGLVAGVSIIATTRFMRRDLAMHLRQ